MRDRLTAVVALASALAASPALCGSIRGSVQLTKASDAERTVVYIETMPEGSFSVPPTAARLSQKGSKFNPAVLPVVRGSQVDMSNDDWVSHNVFSKSPAKTFDLGLYEQDAKKVVTFDKAGEVHVFCSIHSRMNAVVLVLQNPYFTKPAGDGSFRIDDVPAGSYLLKVFRPGEEASAGSRVTVPASGSVEVKF